MDTEYNQNKNNKKGLFFLVLLVGFSMLVLKITKTNDIQLFKESGESVVCANGVVDEGYDNTPVFLDISENGEIKDVTPSSKGQVLGTSCGNALNGYAGTTACTVPGTKDRVSINGWVSSKANVKIVSITVPFLLLSGIYSIKDSNRDLTYDNPIYKPAGEQFNDKQILITSTPGEGSKKVKEEILKGAVVKKPYSTEYTVSTEGAAEGDDVVISKYTTNDCGTKCNNLDNSNPDKSNKIGKVFNRIYYSYPGEKEKAPSSETLEIEGECKDISAVDFNLYTTGCVNVGQVFLGLFGSVFPSSDWTNCGEDEEGCINAEDIVLKISPMFKSTNAFMLARNKSAMSPETANTYKSVFVTTPCKINVANKTVNVKCAWDLSYLFEERKAAEFDDAGGSKTPTHEEYIQFLQNEVSTREDTILDM